MGYFMIDTDFLFRVIGEPCANSAVNISILAYVI